MQLGQISIFGKIQYNATHYRQALKFYLLTRMPHLWLHKSNVAAGYGKYSIPLHCKPGYFKEVGVIRTLSCNHPKWGSCGQSFVSHKAAGWMKCKPQSSKWNPQPNKANRKTVSKVFAIFVNLRSFNDRLRCFSAMPYKQVWNVKFKDMKCTEYLTCIQKKK